MLSISSMSFSLSIFLYIYFVFLAVWFIFSLIGVYHMIKFSFINFISLLAIVLYISVSAALLKVSFMFIGTIDWGVNIGIFQGMLNNMPYIE